MSSRLKPKTIPVSAMWLRKIGNQVQMLAEIEGVWRLIWEEYEDGSFSAICESNGFMDKPLDTLLLPNRDTLERPWQM